MLVLQFMLLGQGYSADSQRQDLNKEASKQEALYHSKADELPEGYVIDRSLLSYIDTLSFDFDRRLAGMGPHDRWLDIGAGKAQAILDYYGSGDDHRQTTKAKAVAISVEDRRTPIWYKTAAALGSNQIQYYFDKRLGGYSLKDLGRFQVITDVFGGFSYTEELSLFMKKALELLELNGTFYTLLQDVKSESGLNRPFYANSSYTTEIADAGGSDVRVCAWLKKISCVEVSCELRTQWKPPIEVYRIHKSCNRIEVPALVKTHFEAGTPPDRRYRIAN